MECNRIESCQNKVYGIWNIIEQKAAKNKEEYGIWNIIEQKAVKINSTKRNLYQTVSAAKLSIFENISSQTKFNK